jgi:hypothetical protein
MRRPLVVLTVLLLAGCGSSGDEELPAACTGGPDPIARALEGAPGRVAVAGVPISRCFNRDASADDVQIMGQGMLVAAQRLGDAAAADPDGPAALKLGYLLGAARRGARRSGVHAELVRRLEQEQGDLHSAEFRRGRRAGLAKG